MRVYKRICIALALALTLAQPVAAIDGHLDVAVRSKAAYRGVLQAQDDKPVYQGTVEVVGDNGAYVGAWLSRAHSERDDRDLEVDYFVGIQRQWNDKLATDVTLQRYTFHGAEWGNDYDWTELQLAAHVGDHLTLLAAVGDNWIGLDERSHVFEATYRYAITSWLNVYGSVGRSFAEDVIGRNYSYRELRIGGIVRGIDVQVSWSDTTMDDSAFADDTWSIGFTRRFSARF